MRQHNACVAAAQGVIVCVGIRAGHSTKIRSQSASVHLPAAQSAFGRALRVRSPGNLDCIRIRSHLQESSGFGCNHAPALQRGRSHHHVPTLFDQLRALASCTVVAHPGHRYLQTRCRRFSFASAAQRPAAHRLRGAHWSSVFTHSRNTFPVLDHLCRVVQTRNQAAEPGRAGPATKSK